MPSDISLEFNLSHISGVILLFQKNCYLREVVDIFGPIKILSFHGAKIFFAECFFFIFNHLNRQEGTGGRVPAS